MLFILIRIHRHILNHNKHHFTAICISKNLVGFNIRIWNIFLTSCKTPQLQAQAMKYTANAKWFVWNRVWQFTLLNKCCIALLQYQTWKWAAACSGTTYTSAVRFTTNEMAPVTRGKETFVVEHTDVLTKQLMCCFKRLQGSAQRDQIILHLIHMHASVKVLHFVYWCCVRVVNTRGKKALNIGAISLFTLHSCNCCCVYIDPVDCNRCKVLHCSVTTIMLHCNPLSVTTYLKKYMKTFVLIWSQQRKWPGMHFHTMKTYIHLLCITATVAVTSPLFPFTDHVSVISLCTVIFLWSYLYCFLLLNVNSLIYV